MCATGTLRDACVIACLALTPLVQLIVSLLLQKQERIAIYVEQLGRYADVLTSVVVGDGRVCENVTTCTSIFTDPQACAQNGEGPMAHASGIITCLLAKTSRGANQAVTVHFETSSDTLVPETGLQVYYHQLTHEVREEDPGGKDYEECVRQCFEEAGLRRTVVEL